MPPEVDVVEGHTEKLIQIQPGRGGGQFLTWLQIAPTQTWKVLPFLIMMPMLRNCPSKWVEAGKERARE